RGSSARSTACTCRHRSARSALLDIRSTVSAHRSGSAALSTRLDPDRRDAEDEIAIGKVPCDWPDATTTACNRGAQSRRSYLEVAAARKTVRLRSDDVPPTLRPARAMEFAARS